MSSYIECTLEINNLAILKKTLDTMKLQYEENTIANGYNTKRNVDLVVRKKELKKFECGTYGDLGFVFDKKENKYNAVIDHYDERILTTIKNVYATETLKDYAKANRKKIEVISGDILSTNKNEEIIITISE